MFLVLICELAVIAALQYAPSRLARRQLRMVDELEATAHELKGQASALADDLRAQGSDAESLRPYGLRPQQIVRFGPEAYKVIRATGDPGAPGARIIGARVGDGKLFGLAPESCKPVAEQ